MSLVKFFLNSVMEKREDRHLNIKLGYIWYELLFNRTYFVAI